MLGPSGSGKTTCLRLIAGFDQPTGGHIEIFGETAEGVPPYRRNVNTVFQDYALFPHMNVLDNVAYGLMVQGRRQGRARTRRRARRWRWSSSPGYGGAAAGPAVRRPAAARGARPRARQPAEGAAARRAARRARPEAARADAGGAEGAAAGARHHLRLRHPRPGRGAVDGRPRGDLQRGPARAGRRAARTSTSGRRPRFVADFVGSSNVLPRISSSACAAQSAGQACGRRTIRIGRGTTAGSGARRHGRRRCSTGRGHARHRRRGRARCSCVVPPPATRRAAQGERVTLALATRRAAPAGATA